MAQEKDLTLQCILQEIHKKLMNQQIQHYWSHWWLNLYSSQVKGEWGEILLHVVYTFFPMCY